MRIDSTIQMYNTFQACRMVSVTAGSDLSLMVETLEKVKEKRKLLLDVPKSWVQQHQQQRIVVSRFFTRQGVHSLSEANQKLFALIEIGTRDLQMRWAAEDFGALRSLGYAFHILPRLLWTSEEFDPKAYEFNFRIACKRWTRFSHELQNAFCDVLGFNQETVAELIEGEGFCL